MAGSYKVTLTWTDWLDRTGNDESWQANGVVYLYGTDRKPYYIGEAGKQTVAERFDSHKDDSVLDCVSRKTNDAFNVKVGYIDLPGDMRLSAELLHDIQTLLIFEEAANGNCSCNVSNTQSRSSYRRGMIVVSEGNYTPLADQYADDGR